MLGGVKTVNGPEVLSVSRSSVVVNALTRIVNELSVVIFSAIVLEELLFEDAIIEVEGFADVSLFLVFLQAMARQQRRTNADRQVNLVCIYWIGFKVSPGVSKRNLILFTDKNYYFIKI
jgi:hypothetical protein